MLQAYPERGEELREIYQTVYRDHIDRTLQRQVLVQHHAPELALLFEGSGRERLAALARKVSAEIGEVPEARRRRVIIEELERYLEQRVLPDQPKSALFYLEYFRTWLADDLTSSSKRDE